MKKEIYVNTSVDDIKSTLALINPKDEIDIREMIHILINNLKYEKEHKNRASVKKMLDSKIKQLGKKL